MCKKKIVKWSINKCQLLSFGIVPLWHIMSNKICHKLVSLNHVHKFLSLTHNWFSHLREWQLMIHIVLSSETRHYFEVSFFLNNSVILVWLHDLYEIFYLLKITVAVTSHAKNIKSIISVIQMGNYIPLTPTFYVR